MEKKELQQLVCSGEVFFQKLFEGPISSIILQHPRLRTIIMMK
jgi:hypothetical protein